MQLSTPITSPGPICSSSVAPSLAQPPHCLKRVHPRGSAQRAGGPPRPPQPQFSGRGKSGALAQELQTFVRRLEATFLLYPSDFSTDAQRVAYAEGFLQPPASEVWSVHAGLNYAEGSASWAQFTAFLLAQSGPSDPAFLALKNYLHIVQRGSLDGYITSFTSVLNAVLALPGGAQLVSNPSFVFYHGLVDSDLKRQLAVDPNAAAFWAPADLQRVIALARTLAAQQPNREQQQAGGSKRRADEDGAGRAEGSGVRTFGRRRGGRGGNWRGDGRNDGGNRGGDGGYRGGRNDDGNRGGGSSSRGGGGRDGGGGGFHRGGGRGRGAEQ